MGEALVTTLVATLWYKDGHHSVLANRNLKVPESLQHFIVASYPGLLKLGEEKAWYTLFAHAR